MSVTPLDPQVRDDAAALFARAQRESAEAANAWAAVCRDLATTWRQLDEALHTTVMAATMWDIAHDHDQRARTLARRNAEQERAVWARALLEDHR